MTSASTGDRREDTRLTHGCVLAIAVPVMLSNVSTPLIGIVDTAIVMNGDIMILSLALEAIFVWFTSQGARHGDVILAANAILMQFIEVSAFFLDGLAFAAEALVGRAVGASQRAGLTAAARMTTSGPLSSQC